MQNQPQWMGSTEFERGIQCGLEIARRQQGRALAEARREGSAAARGVPHPAMTHHGYDAGFADGMRAASKKPKANQNSYTYADLENARRRGFEEGRRLNSTSQPSPAIDEMSIRKKAFEDMLENCRVIAESNPNMASDAFFKAIRHRSKKLIK